jgi:hypothetical protein
MADEQYADVMQLMWEGYHSVERISEWTKLPVRYLEEQFRQYCIDKGEV